MKNSYSVFALFSCTLLLYACGNNSAESNVPPATEKTMQPQANIVSVSQQQYKAIDLQTGSIEQKSLSGIIQANGTLKVPPESKADVTALMAGTVKNIFIKEGDKVSGGQIVATIVNPEFIKMQEEYLNAENNLALASLEYARQKSLSEKNISAQKNFQQAETNYKLLQTKINSLKNQLTLLGIDVTGLSADNITSVIPVKSAMPGSVSKINVNTGSYIEPSDIIMNIIDNSNLHLDLFIFEQDLYKIKVNQKVNFTFINKPNSIYEAQIFSIGSTFENETKTITAHAAITGNKTGLIEGMSVSANIEIENTTTPAILSAAITNSAGNDYIFIQKEEKDGAYQFEKIQVIKGITNNGYTEITPYIEIPSDAKVVINGGFYLMAMLTKNVEED